MRWKKPLQPPRSARSLTRNPSEDMHLHRRYLRLKGRATSASTPRKQRRALQLVINHPRSAWLRIISALVVQIDETLGADQPASTADMVNLIASTRPLFM